MSALEIHALLVASTAHITLDEARQLDAFGYARGDCGWFFYVGEKGCHVLCEIDRFSQGLKGIVRRAREIGCRYVLLDPDANLLEDVATYEW